MANQPVAITFPAIQLIGVHQTYTCTTQQSVTLPVDANGNPTANGWYLQATGQDVWIRFDNNPPGVNGGFQLRAGDPPILFIAPGPGFFFKAIQAAATGFLQAQPINQPF